MGQREQMFNRGISACQKIILLAADGADHAATLKTKGLKREPGMSYAEVFREVNMLQEKAKMLRDVVALLEKLKKSC